jgi:hypothetical protein
MPRKTFYRLSGFLAALGGLIGILDAPLLAMAYFAIPDGAQYLKSPWVAGWTGILCPIVAPLLDFGSPAQVYNFYGWGMAPVFIGFIAGLIGLHTLQSSRANRIEKIGFWVYLTASILYIFGVIGAYGIGALDFSFFAFLVPGLLLSIIGIFIFGIGTLRANVVPRIASWLLILGSIPGMFILGTLIGHNSGRFLLIDVAWIMIGRKLWLASDHPSTNS